ncbi:MAG: hypothetical protein IJD40_05260 [Lachnospiraceae bacterium]|nr:hypothetical protein [Lachnospiraceae bacterium]
MDKEKNIKETLDEKNPEILSLEEFFGEDFQKEADFIGERLQMDPELVQKALDGAEAFMEFAEGKEEYIVEDIDEDGLPIKAISGDALMAFVSEKTGIDVETLDKIYDCEVDYFEQFGLME